jgi:hypothetical protein
MKWHKKNRKCTRVCRYNARTDSVNFVMTVFYPKIYYEKYQLQKKTIFDLSERIRIRYRIKEQTHNTKGGPAWGRPFPVADGTLRLSSFM